MTPKSAPLPREESTGEKTENIGTFRSIEQNRAPVKELEHISKGVKRVMKRLIAVVVEPVLNEITRRPFTPRRSRIADRLQLFAEAT